jgi:hypothetical protein
MRGERRTGRSRAEIVSRPAFPVGDSWGAALLSSSASPARGGGGWAVVRVCRISSPPRSASTVNFVFRSALIVRLHRCCDRQLCSLRILPMAWVSPGRSPFHGRASRRSTYRRRKARIGPRAFTRPEGNPWLSAAAGYLTGSWLYPIMTRCPASTGIATPVTFAARSEFR